MSLDSAGKDVVCQSLFINWNQWSVVHNGAERVERGFIDFRALGGDRAGTGKQSVNDNQIRIRLVGWWLAN